MTRVQRIQHYDKLANEASTRAFRLRVKSCKHCQALSKWPDSVLIQEGGLKVHLHRGVGEVKEGGTMTVCGAYHPDRADEVYRDPGV